MSNVDIGELKIFKFRMQTALKSAPFNEHIKAMILSEVDNIKMSLAAYGKMNKSDLWPAFVQRAATRAETALVNAGVRPDEVARAIKYIKGKR